MTRHQIDPRQFSDSDLARHLLTVRGVQWMNGDRGAPLALLLRDHGVDPHTLHATLRGTPVLRQTDLDVWVTACHEPAAALLADPRLTSQDTALGRRRRRVYSLGAGATVKYVLTVDDTALAADHADSARSAELTRDWLSGPAVERHRARTAAAFTGLALPDGERDAFDLLTDFVRPGTVAALAGLLGLPPGSVERYAALLPATTHVLDSLLCPPTLAAGRALVEGYDGIAALVDQALAAPPELPDGALAGLLRAAGGDTAPVRSVALLTLVVGARLATGLACSTVAALLAHPDEWDAVRREPARAEAAVAETLRYDPPVRVVGRIAGEAMEIAGLPIAAGDLVTVLVDAAQRDPAAHPEPDRFLPGRTAGAAPLVFADPRISLLEPVVRLVATEAVRVLVARRPRLTPAGEPVRHIRVPVTGAVARFPVRTAGRTAATQDGAVAAPR
ncbi:cytochrome P450 family protein [Streptomyces lancefieldiae]|uniref:P450-derived glycosyltransferase activator n=1 Tax=Streptomyces lancefieldiae TaxID=3075520 RepID=A0ABU3AKV4_9ACTN|nr:P450-derived glycosyltransferase activator [Streptomyces sp. DSM 40712]MDT0610825.1 P450-derived glycosyltransferase activator [Streptomyces sp. DSM 40712]